jgi:iron(III) transport system substrate-binding protein
MNTPISIWQNRGGRHVAAMALSLMLFVCASAAMAQGSDWSKAWDETLAAARKEGKVVVVGSPDPVMRNEIIPRFTAQFGIAVEFIAGASGPTSARVRLERASGIYAVDVFMAGVGTTFLVLHAEKMLDPIRPLLMRPDVTEVAAWKRGKPSFADPEDQYVLALFSSVDSLLFINTDRVKPDEMRAATDLLNPKWRDKIATQDPNATGSGSETAVHFYRQLGPEFVRKLYVDQKPVKNQDRRQLADWLARGTYPICLTCKVEHVSALQKDGFKLLEVFDLAGMHNRVTPSPFLLSFANKAPHPNAARIFVNWMAGKEALEIYSRKNGTATLRADVDESFLDPHIIPRPGTTYVENSDPQWISSGRRAATQAMRALLR